MFLSFLRHFHNLFCQQEKNREMQSIHETAKEAQETSGETPAYDFTSKLVEAKVQAKVVLFLSVIYYCIYPGIQSLGNMETPGNLWNFVIFFSVCILCGWS